MTIFLSWQVLTFSFKKWTISDKVWFKLGQSKELIRAISNTPLTPVYRSKIYSVNLIKGAWATTAIEGNTLSEEEIALIYKGESLSISKQYMKIEVKNVWNALNLLRNGIVEDCKTSYLIKI